MDEEGRWTRQREAVYEVIQQAEKHLTAQEIYDRVRERLPGIAYGTVYNALAYLQEAGLVRTLNVGGGPTLYDRRVERHDHVVCRRCGKVVDYLWQDWEAAIERVAQETGFYIEAAHVLFQGLCSECRQATKGQVSSP